MKIFIEVGLLILLCLIFLMIGFKLRDKEVAELTARTDSLQAKCDSLHQVINTSPRYMKGMVWYFNTAEPEDTIIVAPDLIYRRVK